MPNVEAALTTARLYTHPMRRLPALALVPLLAGCSLISLDLTPRIEPLQEQTVEGHGRAKILLLDVSGFLSDEGGAPSLVIGGPAPPRGPLPARAREAPRGSCRSSGSRPRRSSRPNAKTWGAHCGR